MFYVLHRIRKYFEVVLWIYEKNSRGATSLA